MSASHPILDPVVISASDMEDAKHSQNPATKPHVKSSKARLKPQLSCTSCRTRKLKCDRNLPCENCVKRDLAFNCTYVHSSSIRDTATHVHKYSSVSTPKDVHGRIRHLEELVVSLMHSKTGQGQILPSAAEASVLLTISPAPHLIVPESHLSNPVASVEGNDLQNTDVSLGRISIEDEIPNYVGGAHWAAVLDSIAGLKDSLEYNEWSKEEVSQHSPSRGTGPDLLVGSVKMATRAEILTSIPPRHVVDLLVEYVLDLRDIAIVLTSVHSTTFKKEYEQFWVDPDKCPIMWIGLLYSIMGLSLNIKLIAWDNEQNMFNGLAQRDPQEMMIMFREKTIQCLVLGNYTEPTAYTVETLLTYYLLEHVTRPVTDVGGWMVIGLTVRAAMRLGYHRDPSKCPNLSCFRKEIRRRQWAVLLHLDIITSSCVGLPRMIQPSMCDTQLPRNLYDEDFDEFTTVLPPSRPDSDMTPIGYMTLQHNLQIVNGLIADQASCVVAPSYEEVLRLDQLLHDANNKIPDILRVKSVEDLKTGSPDLRVWKFSTNSVFQKASCVLHRKFLLPPKSSAICPYPYSTKSCVDSSMAIIQAQALLYVETRPGQVLHPHKWKTMAPMTQDFLLAAMIICLYVSHSISEAPNIPGSELSINWTRDEMIEALDGAFKIWNTSKCPSKEALKAAKALKAMVARIRNSQSPNLISKMQLENNAAPNGSASLFSFLEQTKQNGYGSEGGATATTDSSPWQLTSSGPYQPPPLDTSYGLVDDMMNGLDWKLWDTQFNNNLGHTPPELWNLPDASFDFTNHGNDTMTWDL